MLQWERSWGNDEYDKASSLVATDDGGFMLTGDIDGDLWLLKTDRRGKAEWEQLINNGFGGTQAGHAIIRAHEAGYYMVAGYSEPAYNIDREAWLFKVGEDGEMAWPYQVYGLPTGDDSFAGMAATADGGYILVGTWQSPTEWSHADAWVVKTDGAGNLEWEHRYNVDGRTEGLAVTPAADGGFLLLTDLSAASERLVKTDALGVPEWTNSVSSRSWQWIGTRESPHSGFLLLGASDGKDICLKFLDLEGGVVDTKTWTGSTTLRDPDVGNSATRTPDGSYLIVGVAGFRPGGAYTSLRDDVALVKTDAEGNTHWVEFLPGTLTIDEQGLAAVALTNNAYVVLGERGTGEAEIWLVKLAYNHPPVPQLVCSSAVTNVGEAFTFDGGGSTDPDGAVVLHEWDFGDGQVAEGVVVAHAYTNSGAYVVEFTAVDDEDAERSLAVTNYVAGIRLSGLDSRFTMLGCSITNCPACDPATYPRNGVPLRVEWASARGFRLTATATSSATRHIRITFPDPVPEGLTLYRMPGWTVVPYTRVDPHTIEISLWLAAGSIDLACVLTGVAPLPSVLTLQPLEASRLALTFSTTAGFRYGIQRSPHLSPGAWTGVPLALALGDPVTLDAVPGTGGAVGVLVELPPENSSFFGIAMEPTEP